MIDDPALQWALTALFLVTATYSGCLLLLERRPLAAVGHLLHIGMSLGMVLMCWPWWSQLPVLPQLIVFGGAAGWFALVYLAQVSRRIPRRAAGDHGPVHQALHAMMMLAMVWMVAAMTSAPGSPVATSGYAHTAMSVPVVLAGVVMVTALVVAGVLFLLDCAEAARTCWHVHRSHTLESASGSLMSLGMVAMCWPMLVG
ncbi:DUF5134 domain-containing protein [Promicromonospora alba]|uniref:DUF5134 domain-containing protein n=1 Tax=Promicromonospora alba TaxID=1616110 RepID=A0ABV9HEC1_9MICO